jgi:tetratricopeptide (TPR) repeat protein
VSGRFSVSDGRIPDTVVINIDSSVGDTGLARFMEEVEPLLAELNWRTHFFVVSAGYSEGLAWLRPVIEALARFVSRNEFVSFYVHPVIPVGSTAGVASRDWENLLEWVRPFQEQAYEQQSEARLLILPIIAPAASESSEVWLTAARFFGAHLAKPSVFLSGPGALDEARRGVGREIRFYVEPDREVGTAGIIRQLWRNHVFEELLDRVKAGGANPEGEADTALLAPCRSHLLIEQRTRNVFACFHEWNLNLSRGVLGEAGALIARTAGELGSVPCDTCCSQSVCLMTDNLRANDRLSEGGRVHLALALAFSRRMDYCRAIEHATRAREFLSSDADRAAALVCQGLSHLALRQLLEAESALQEAMDFSEDPGLVAYHRGRVQFEWRDYIEALDRFEEALASGSATVPEADLFFYMAVSHVTLEEFAEARPYLERWERTGSRRAVMLYYRGLCDVGEGKFDSALSAFRAAEKAEPANDDLGRILFYSGHCLKELGCYEEAIPVLERAAAVDAGEIAVVNLLGFCFYKTARHGDAVRCFARALELDPRSAIDYANLATNLRELGRIDEAIANYRRALSLDPGIAFARENLEKLIAPLKEETP